MYLWKIKLNVHIVSCRNVLTQLQKWLTISVNPPTFFWNAIAKSEDWSVMYIYISVMGLDHLFLRLLHWIFRNVPTMYYFILIFWHKSFQRGTILTRKEKMLWLHYLRLICHKLKQCFAIIAYNYEINNKSFSTKFHSYVIKNIVNGPIVCGIISRVFINKGGDKNLNGSIVR